MSNEEQPSASFELHDSVNSGDVDASQHFERAGFVNYGVIHSYPSETDGFESLGDEWTDGPQNTAFQEPEWSPSPDADDWTDSAVRKHNGNADSISWGTPRRSRTLWSSTAAMVALICYALTVNHHLAIGGQVAIIAVGWAAGWWLCLLHFLFKSRADSRLHSRRALLWSLVLGSGIGGLTEVFIGTGDMVSFLLFTTGGFLLAGVAHMTLEPLGQPRNTLLR